MSPQISVSKEYIETVCDWLENWAQEKDSWIIPQFLKKCGIGWSYFEAMKRTSSLLNYSFEVTVAGLAAKWLLYAKEKEDLPPHMQKVLLKYMRVYDQHSYQVDQEAKKELAQNPTISVKNYAAENYSKEQLEGLHKRLYDVNDDQRRSGKKAQ